MIIDIAPKFYSALSLPYNLQVKVTDLEVICYLSFIYSATFQIIPAGPVAWWIRELTLNLLGFSPLWFEPRSGHMWESQVLLTDGQVVFLRVLQFSPTLDE